MRKLWRGNQIFKGLGHRDPRLEDFDKLDVICTLENPDRFVKHTGPCVTGSMKTVSEFRCAVFILQRTSMLAQSFHFPGRIISKTTEVGKQE